MGDSARSSVDAADLAGDLSHDLAGDWTHETTGLNGEASYVPEGMQAGGALEASDEFNPFSDSGAAGGPQRLSAADLYNAKRRAARNRMMGRALSPISRKSSTEEGSTQQQQVLGPIGQLSTDSSGLVSAGATFSLSGTNVPSQSLVGAFFTMGPRAEAAANMIAAQNSLESGSEGARSILDPPSLSFGVLPVGPDQLPATTGRNRSKSMRSATSGQGALSPTAGGGNISFRSATGGGMASGDDEGGLGSSGSDASSAVGSSLGSDDSAAGMVHGSGELGGSDDEAAAFLDHNPMPDGEDDTFELALQTVAQQGSDMGGGTLDGQVAKQSTSPRMLLDDTGAEGGVLKTQGAPPLPPAKVDVKAMMFSPSGDFSFAGAGSRGDVLSASSSPASSSDQFTQLRRGASHASSAPSDTEGGTPYGRLGIPASPTSGGGWNSRGPSRLGLGGSHGQPMPRSGNKRRSAHRSEAAQAANTTFKEGLRVLRRLAGQSTMLPNSVLFKVIVAAVAAYGIMTLPMILALEFERQFVMPLLASLDVGAAAVSISAANVVGLSLIPDMLNPKVGAWAWSRPEDSIVLGVLDDHITLDTALQTPSWWNNGRPFVRKQLNDLRSAAVGVARSRLDVLEEVGQRLDRPLRTPIRLEDGVSDRFYTFLSAAAVLGVSILDLLNTPVGSVSQVLPSASILISNHRGLGMEYVSLLQGYADVYITYLSVYDAFYDASCFAAFAMILFWVLIPQYSLQIHLNRTMVSAVRNFALVPKALVYQQQKASKRRLLAAERQLRKENGQDDEEEGKVLSLKAQEAIKRSIGVNSAAPIRQYIGSAYAGSSTRSGVLSSSSGGAPRRLSTGFFSAAGTDRAASSTRNLSLAQSSGARDLSAATYRGGGGRRLSQYSAAPASARRQSTAATNTPRTPKGRNTRRAMLGGLQGATARMRSSRGLLTVPATGQFEYATKTHRRTWARTWNIYLRLGLIAWLYWMKNDFVSNSILGVQQLGNVHLAAYSSSRNVAAVHSILNSAFTNKTVGEIEVALNDATVASRTLQSSLEFIAFGSDGADDPVVGRPMSPLPEGDEYDTVRRLLTTNACEGFAVDASFAGFVDCPQYVRSLNAAGRGLVGVAEEMRNLVSRLVATARVFPLAGRTDQQQGIVDVREIVATARAGNSDSAANRVGLLQILQSDLPYLRQQLQRVAREIETALQRERDTVISRLVSYIIVSFTVGFVFLMVEMRQSTVAARRAYAVRLLIIAVPKQMAFAVGALLQQYHDFTELGDVSVRRSDGVGGGVSAPGQATPGGGGASTARGGRSDTVTERTGMLSNAEASR